MIGYLLLLFLGLRQHIIITFRFFIPEFRRPCTLKLAIPCAPQKRSSCERGHIALQNSPYYNAKEALLGCETGPIATQ